MYSFGTVILSLEAGRLYAEWMAGGGVEPSDASNASVSGGFGFGVDLVLAVPADEAAAIA